MTYQAVEKDYFLVKWQITTQCNYRCSYCTQIQKVKNIPYTIELLKTRAVSLSKLFKKVPNKIKLVLAGGEISIINELVQILDCLHSPNLSCIEFITNFSQPLPYYENLLNWCTQRNIELQFYTSFHEEFAKEEEFFEKINQFQKHFEKALQVECVVTSKNYQYMESLKKKYNCNFRFDPNKQEPLENIPFNFSESELSHYNNQHLSFKGCTCYQYGLILKSDGRLYSNNCKLLSFGNIDDVVDEAEAIKPHEIICSKERCPMCHVQKIY